MIILVIRGTNFINLKACNVSMQKRGKVASRRTKSTSSQRKLKPLKTENKLHMGLRGLIEYTTILIIGGIINVSYNFMQPNKLVQSFPHIRIFETILIVWLLFVLYGFFDRKHWVWVLSMACFGMLTVYSLFLHYQLRILEILSFEMFLLLSLLSLLMNFTVLWYIYQKKMHFTNPYFIDKYSLTDKIFVNVMLCVIILILAISITIFKLSSI